MRYFLAMRSCSAAKAVKAFYNSDIRLVKWVMNRLRPEW